MSADIGEVARHGLLLKLGGPVALGVSGVLMLALVLSAAAAGTPPTAGTSCGAATTAVGDAVTVTGQVAGLTTEQQRNAQAIAGVALARGLGERGVLVGVVTALAESSLINVGHGDAIGPSSIGLFQQMTGWGPLAARTDPAGSAGLFYDALLKLNPSWTTLSIPTAAQAVEQSEFDGTTPWPGRGILPLGQSYADELARGQAITATLIVGQPAALTAGTAAGTPLATPVAQCSAATAGGSPGGVPVVINGVDVTLPAPAGVVGVIHAPTAQVAKAISAGLSQLGVTYAWGGGDANGPTPGIHDGGVADAHGDYNKTGYDCAGLMLYSFAQAGLSSPRDSQAQAHSGQQVPFAGRMPGDMIGYTGHIALYLGQLNGQDYMLEAPLSGDVVKVSVVRGGHYPAVARIWTGTGSSP